MKEKLDKILDTSLKSVLAILIVFGLLQFVIVATATLFGVQFGWLQYVASVVLLGVGIASTIFLVRITEE